MSEDIYNKQLDHDRPGTECGKWIVAAENALGEHGVNYWADLEEVAPDVVQDLINKGRKFLNK